MNAERGRKSHAIMKYQVMGPPGVTQLGSPDMDHYRTDSRERSLTNLNIHVC